MKKIHFLLLIIYTLFFSETIGQNLYLKVEGNSIDETQVIDSLNYKNQFKDFKELSFEKEQLQNKLFALGYIENEELESDKINDSTLAIRYSLKKQYKFIHIYFDESTLNRSYLKSIVADVHDAYFSISFAEVESVLNLINQHLANQGTPFKTLRLKNIIKKDAEVIRADLVASSDKKRMVDKVIVQGYEKFPKSFLKRFLKIKPQQNFNLQDIKSKTEALNELSFAGQIKDPEVLFTNDSTTLYMYLEKKPSNTFDGFLGFGTNENTNKIEFDGYLNLNLVNNLNFGESIKLLYKSDENDQKTFNGNLKLPYLFASPLGVALELNIFKKDSSFSTVGQFAKIYYQINSNSNIGAGIRNIQSNNLLDGSSTLLIDDYDSSYYNLGYNYSSNQTYNLLFPINFFLAIESGLGERKFENEKQDQFYTNFDAFKIFNLNRKNSIYTRLNGSFLFSDDYLFNELYRFGGINSIRGFEENSLFANLYAVLNTEYRYQLTNSIYVNSIIDAAYYENDLSELKEKLFGFGFGFGLLTNAGLLKFNYANGKSENQKFKFSDSKIHISLTAKF